MSLSQPSRTIVVEPVQASKPAPVERPPAGPAPAAPERTAAGRP